MVAVNRTHDLGLRSWVESANQPGSEFPIQNLPFAVARRAGSEERYRIVVAIGDSALDLRALNQTGLVPEVFGLLESGTLNEFMAAGSSAWSEVRHCLSELLKERAGQQELVADCLLPLSELEYTTPARIGDYTDFYTSIHHATNIGKLFRPDNPLLPNYEWIPIGYHGRSSSIGVNQSFHRPNGQLKAPDAQVPVVEPCKRLDYELEVGIFVGSGNSLGQAIEINDAENHIFGLCLLNDWSARDIQTWEYQPLGPFLAKSFASTISPWIVTMEALAPFRAPFQRGADHSAPLPYLSSKQNSEAGAVDMQLEVYLQTAAMEDAKLAPERLSRSNFTDSFWTMAQMLTHHTVNGCNLMPGDFFGSGTMSGSGPGSQGALIEITKGGAEPITLANGETRTFLEDGDRVMMRARCEREGYVTIGFGECAGKVLPALP